MQKILVQASRAKIGLSVFFFAVCFQPFLFFEGALAIAVGATFQKPNSKEVNKQFTVGSLKEESGKGSGEVKPLVTNGVKGRNWASWRGPLGTGEAVGARPPVHWSEKENIRWKIELPGKGHSTPIIWNNHVVITYAAPVGKPFPPIKDRRRGSHDNLPVTHKFQ